MRTTGHRNRDSSLAERRYDLLSCAASPSSMMPRLPYDACTSQTIKEVVDREIQSSASSSGLRVGRGAGGAASPSFPTSSTATLSSTASLLNPHPSTLLARRGSQKRSITARLGLAIVTGGASDGRERERERDHGLLSITEGSTVTGGSSRRPSGSSTASSSSSPNLPPVQEALASSIPFKTTPGLPADPSSKRSTDADTDTLPSSALTWMEFAEMDGDGQEVRSLDVIVSCLF